MSRPVAPPAARSRRSTRRGATLVEVLTVAVVAAVAAGVALEGAGAWAPTAAEDAGRAFADDLRYARARAVATGRRHVLRVNAAAGEYTLVEPAGDVPDPRRPGRAGPFVRRFEADHPGVELQRPLRAGDAAPRDGVAFLPDGTAADPENSADKTDTVFWFTAPDGGGASAAGRAPGRLAVRVRAVGATGQAWADGPRPQNATLPAWLAAGEPRLGAD